MKHLRVWAAVALVTIFVMSLITALWTGLKLWRVYAACFMDCERTGCLMAQPITAPGGII